MRISHKHKFIWVSKPKTGSTSYRKLLDPFCDVTSSNKGDFYHHSSMKMIINLFRRENWKFDEYVKVVPSRNPYNLLLSLFAYSKMDVNSVKWWESQEKPYMPDKLMSFTQFMDMPENKKWFEQMHKLENYILDDMRVNVADFIFDPTIQEDKFKNFMNERVGLNFKEQVIPRSNKTLKSKELLEEARVVYSSPNVKRFVEQVFSLEIKMFEYENPFI